MGSSSVLLPMLEAEMSARLHRRECDWSCSQCHVLSGAGGKASFSAPKMRLGEETAMLK